MIADARSATATSGRHILNVQILRFFAALLVVFAHVGVEVSNVAERTSRSFELTALLDWGLGVDVFFVISGFIMYYLMHDRFARPGISLDFFRRRLVRIVPLYWICTTLMLISLLLAKDLINNNGLEFWHVVASYAFVPWKRPDEGIFPILSLGWTLNYEMFFYVVFALALRWPRRIGLTGVIVFFVALIAAAELAPAEMWLLKFWGNPIIGEFLLGILLAALFLDDRRLSLPVSAALVVGGIILAVIFYQTATYEHVWRLITGGLPALMIAAGVILGPSAGRGRIARLLATGGDASYALYLTHPFSIKVFGIVCAKFGLSLAAIFWLGLVVTVIVSLIVHFAIEKPVGAWLNAVTRPSGTKAVARPPVAP